MAYADTSKKEVREKVHNKFGGCCAYCGCILGEKFTIDHIIPKRRNMGYSRKEVGADEIDNYNPSCYSCNSSKSTFSIDEWRDQIERKISMLNRDSSTYRIAKRFGLIAEINKGVKFYFEYYEKS